MTSSVFFKFKSQKEPSRIEFDGTGISVFELKRDIIIKSGLGDGTEFDLAIYNQDSNQEYDDDTTIIPRSTTVVARRLPPQKAGAGRAARYMTGKMPINAKNSSRKETPAAGAVFKPKAAASAPQINNNMTEEERMAVMFAQQSEAWTAQQDEMANQAPVFRPGQNKKGGPPVNVPDHEPPSGYICYRCGEKGHWIQVCPTNDDPNFDNKPRVKRTTGIPRSFLKTVEKPIAVANDGTTDDTKAPSGVMVNAEGEYVVAEPDAKSWEQYQAKTKSSADKQKAAKAGDKELQDRGLECPIDKRMFIDPMKTPCCEKTYCNDCITNALIESDFTCPGCQTDEVLIDNLITDEDMIQKIKDYEAEKAKQKEEKSKSKSPEPQQNGVKVATPEAEIRKEKPSSKSPSPPPSDKSKKSSTQLPTDIKESLSPGTADLSAPTGPSKKRPADELLENPKIPRGPKAMQQQQQQQQQAPAMPNGINPMGFQNMPGMPPFDISQMNQFGMGNMMNPYAMGMNTMMMNPMMMNGFVGMNGMSGFPNMNMSGGNMGGYGGYGNNMGGNMSYGQGNQQNGYGAHGQAGHGGHFPNQQKTFNAQAQGSEEESAYFRAPVNLHRNRNYPKRERPSDYREL